MPPTNCVFVYGSLLRALHNHHLLRGQKLLNGSARTAEAAYRLVDTSEGYPMALKCSDVSRGYRIRGEVYDVDESRLHVLDQLEDHPRWYRRERVRIEGDPEEEAWMYLMPDASKGALPDAEPAGDWRTHVLRKEGTTRLMATDQPTLSSDFPQLWEQNEHTQQRAASRACPSFATGRMG